MKIPVYLRIARDVDGSMLVKADTKPNFAALTSKAAGITAILSPPKALQTAQRLVVLNMPDSELAGQVQEG